MIDKYVTVYFHPELYCNTDESTGERLTEEFRIQHAMFGPTKDNSATYDNITSCLGVVYDSNTR